MRLPGRKKATALASWLRTRGGPRAVVLGYHRVSDEAGDIFGLCVSPATFEEQLAAIRRHALPCRLGEIARALDNRDLSRRRVAVTFDDGYADLLHVAKPLLEACQIPATVFVVSGYLGREFWWDALERIVPAHEYLQVYRRLLPLSDDQRWGEIRTLAGRAGVDLAPRHGTLRRAMTQEELAAIADGGTIEVGGHSVSHPRLGLIDANAVAYEVGESKHRLEEVTGRAISGMSYPHGSFSFPVMEAVQTAGYAFACGSSHQPCSHRSDTYHLPRLWAPSWGGARFDAWLRWWLG